MLQIGTTSVVLLGGSVTCTVPWLACEIAGAAHVDPALGSCCFPWEYLPLAFLREDVRRKHLLTPRSLALVFEKGRYGGIVPGTG